MSKALKSQTLQKREHYIREKGGCDSAMLRQKYAYKITDTIKEAMNGDVHSDPVAKQYIPQAAELKILPEERLDPIGDDVHKPVKGVVHRYPDRVLLKLANVCAVYCRYCFRREKVGPGADILNVDERETALDYIRSHPDIWEVILTGGDPLVLSARHLGETLDALEEIEHVKSIRIHTRIPIADPKRIGADMLRVLKRAKPVYMVLHINHAQELTQEVRACLKALHAAGVVMLSQSVLLKGINNDAQILEALCRDLITLHVKPYYIHHPDLAPGTSHFRLSLEEGQRIMRSLLGRLSGICMPTYMLDIPGGFGKVPVNESFVKPLGEGRYLIEDYQGVTHHYPPQGGAHE